jgi:hypothetical protein
MVVMFADTLTAAVVLPALSMQEAYRKLVDETPAVPPAVAPLDVGAATFAVAFTVSEDVVTEGGVMATGIAPLVTSAKLKTVGFGYVPPRSPPAAPPGVRFPLESHVTA